MLKNINRYAKVAICLVFTLILFCSFSNVKAASAGISASSTEVTAGTKVSINVSITAASWNVRMSGAISDTIVGYDENASNKTTYKSYTLNTNAPGTYTVSLSGDITDANGSNSDVGGSVTVVVKAASTASNTSSSSNTTTSTNTSNYYSNSSGSTSSSSSGSSSNANLSNLVIDQEGLSPMFSSTVTSYTLTVPEKVTKLNITPSVEQAGAKYWIEGDENLEMGENKVTITVTAPNGNKKVYTITVNRVEDVDKADVSLKSLIIDGVELDPEFSPDTLEYSLGEFDSSVKKLTILAFANSDKAKVEIEGNGDFKEGENIIKVKVTAEDGKTTREYILKFNMDASSEQETEEDPYQYIDDEPTRWQNFLNNAKKNKLMLLLLLVMIIELIEIIVLYKKLYGKKNDDEIKEESKSDSLLESPEEEKTESRRRRGMGKTIEAAEESESALPEAEVATLAAEKSAEEVVEEKSEDINEATQEEEIKVEKPKESVLNLENIKSIKKKLSEDKEDEVEESAEVDSEVVEEKEEAKPAEKVEEIDTKEDTSNVSKSDNLPEIDFETLVKETLAKYEQEDMKEADTKVDEDEKPKKTTRGRKKNS